MLGIATDKLLHFGVCFLINFIVSTSIPSQAMGGVEFSAGLSIGKEYGDSKAIGNYWDNYDLLADGIGISVGVSTGLLVNKLILDGKNIF